MIYLISCVILCLLHIILIDIPNIKIELSGIDMLSTDGFFESVPIWSPLVGVVIILILAFISSLIFEEDWKKIYKMPTFVIFLILSIITALFSFNFLVIYLQDNPYDFFKRIPSEFNLFLLRGSVVFLFCLLIGIYGVSSFIFLIYLIFSIIRPSSIIRPFYRRGRIK